MCRFWLEYFVTATESEQGISAFGWLLKDRGAGWEQPWEDPGEEGRRLWGRTCTKARSLEKLNLFKEQQRSHEVGPGRGEAEAGDDRHDSATQASTGCTQVLDFLPNAPEEPCALELRDDL